jgi:hypothetical protein
MRKPKVVIFNYNSSFVNDLVTFFRNRGYEQSVVSKPVNALCPMYGNRQHGACIYPVPCCDIMVVAEESEHVKGVDLLSRQSELGCKLIAINKAVIRKSLTHDRWDETAYKGITVFTNPRDFHGLEPWVKECEGRTDLLQRIVVMRREERHACSIPVRFRQRGDDADGFAVAVNKGHCGVCLRISKPIERGREIQYRIQSSGDVNDGVVQWVKEIEDGWYLSGVTLCV